MSKDYLLGGTAGQRPRSAADHYQVVVHTDESALHGGLGRSDLPIDTVKRVVDQLRAGGDVQHAFLGVGLADEAADGGGVAIEEISEGGPADDAGLQSGDVIVAIDGDKVETPEDVRTAIDSHQPGDEIEVEVRRDGDTQTETVTLGERPDQVR